jgi:hypothetical protein
VEIVDYQKEGIFNVTDVVDEQSREILRWWRIVRPGHLVNFFTRVSIDSANRCHHVTEEVEQIIVVLI